MATKSPSKKSTTLKSPAVQPSREMAAKPKPRSSGTFKPGGELSATIK